MELEELGSLAIKRGDFQEALNIYRRALEKEKSVTNYSGIGKAFYNLEDFPAARWAFYKVLERQQKNREAVDYISIIENRTKRTDTPNRQSLFRVSTDYLEIYKDGWKKFFLKGINLGLGLPGHFPGEYAVKKGTYLTWFKQMAEIGINAIRIYTVHPPSFYEALYDFNQSDQKIYLLQGIWYELPPKNNFYDKRFDEKIKDDLKNAVDVIYGNADLPDKPGYASGIYGTDISPYTLAFIFGRECESTVVREFNERRGRELSDYGGAFLSMRRGTPFEVWVTRTCDILQQYEHEQYGYSHPLSVTNWPTLDPLYHPSETAQEREFMLQGIAVDATRGYAGMQEDTESLDVAKIKVEQGSGFFATYHPYPYYPDFMNNDYLDADEPYRAYLKDLKRHHGDQPVLAAEFGVPSSRDIAHWHRQGWHHGGHNEEKQGEINGRMMKAIYEAGMAGGIVFSWYDEWFKKNWMFFSYYIPGDRKPLWFNLQDPEENYGLLSTYPGYPEKKVYLAGRDEDWKNAVHLYRKKDSSITRTFGDGFDESRKFEKLLVQHDEGFMYIRIDMMGEIDLSKANYVIGLDTCCSEYGEFKLPNNMKLSAPVGLKFLIQITGKGTSRILVCSHYDKYLNVTTDMIKPLKSEQGAWVLMQNRTNNRRISRDEKRFYPSRTFSMSSLRFGSLETGRPDYNSCADFFFSGSMLELRIPWSLINFTDPSSKTVLWQDNNGMTRKTDGIRIMAFSYKPEAGQLFAQATGSHTNVTDHLPEVLTAENVMTYTWKNWNVPLYHSYKKDSYHIYKNVLSTIPELV